MFKKKDVLKSSNDEIAARFVKKGGVTKGMCVLIMHALFIKIFQFLYVYNVYMHTCMYMHICVFVHGVCQVQI